MRNPSNYLLFLFFLLVCCVHGVILQSDDDFFRFDHVVTKEKRRTVALTDSGTILAVDIGDGYRGPYHIQFITLEPNSLFVPVLLLADMVFYVHTGRGRLGWVEEGEDMHRMELEKGDIYSVQSGSVFHVQSHADPTREKLRIYAFFTNRIDAKSEVKYMGAYVTLSDLVLGFDKRTLQMAFKVSEDLIEGMMKAAKPPPIVHLTTKNDTGSKHLDWRAGIFEAFIRGESLQVLANNKKKKTFNILRKKPDFENCNGRSIAVNHKDFHPLKGSDIGLFMVNLTKEMDGNCSPWEKEFSMESFNLNYAEDPKSLRRGSMMGPHWNPRASEIAIVTQGQGMVRVVCSRNSNKSTDGQESNNDSTCQNSRFRVKEGDVFAVPRFNPMAQMSFNNDSLVFMGFSTMAKKNHPQFLAGKRSVFQALDEKILSLAFNVPNTTIRALLDSQAESIILECTSCAEEEEKKMDEEIQREKEREKEEARRREEEEEARREEEEAKRRQEEEEARRREEEEARRRQEEEEEETRRREEEEATRRQEEEEAARRREEEEEEARRRQEEEEARRGEEQARREEEEARREEEERQERRRQEEEVARKAKT